MKTNIIIIKILILFSALIVVVGGILLYEKTKVAPPKDIPQIDVYAEYLKKCQNEMSKELTDTQKDSVFNSFIVHITTFRREGKISDSVADDFLAQAVNDYVPGYVERCNSKFTFPTWYSKDHDDMLNRIKTLEELRYSNSSPVIDPNYEDLKKIKGIIAKYRKACVLTQNTAYRGLDDAKKKIKEANEYANDEYLSKCSNLHKDLLAVRGKIADSHLQYVSSTVNKLQLYKSYNKDDYYKLNTHVRQVLDNYHNSKSLYGKAYNSIINDLYDKAKKYRNDADKYYVRDNR